MINLVLRQQFAIKYLEILKKPKIIVNADESWINEFCFLRRKWKVPGTTNSVSIK